jgi:hypothetical protein
MKYSILINQAGIVDAGLNKSTDLTDWALLSYIADWQMYGKAQRLDDHVWLDYKHLMAEMPMLGLNSKSSVSNRVTKLSSLDLLSIKHDDYSRVFVKLTDLFVSVFAFRPEMQVKSEGSSKRTGVPENERGFLKTNGEGSSKRTGVPENEHSIDYKKINNQDNKLPESKDIAHSRKQAKIDGDDLQKGFEEFWAEYPKKKGKVEALKSWMRIKPNEKLRKIIIGAVVIAKSQDFDWIREGGKFIPYPATYLNGERWNDEITKSPTPAANRKPSFKQPAERPDYSSLWGGDFIDSTAKVIANEPV